MFFSDPAPVPCHLDSFYFLISCRLDLNWQAITSLNEVDVLKRRLAPELGFSRLLHKK